MKVVLSAIVLAGMFGAAQAMDGPMSGNAASSTGQMQSPGSSGQMGHKSEHKGKKSGSMQGGAMQHSGAMRSDHMMSGGSMQHTGSGGAMHHKDSGGAMQKKHHDAPDQDN